MAGCDPFFYRLPGLINHSCMFNLSIHFSNRKTMSRAFSRVIKHPKNLLIMASSIDLKKAELTSIKYTNQFCDIGESIAGFLLAFLGNDLG